METEKRCRKYENWIIASAVLLVLLLVLGIRCDYYFDLNDDVVIKDILAGVYTGEPEAHNIQLLYPLSLALSLLYRILPGAPVYGIFLCLCQYGSLWLVMGRSLGFCRSTAGKAVLGAAEGAALYALLAGHLTAVQYTFTSAMLAAAAAFLFLTIEPGLSGRAFIKKSVPCVLLALLSYLLRTEMLTLLLPLICVAGICRWAEETEIGTKDNFKKYLTVFGLILAGMLVGTAANAIAFGSGEWKEYTDYFDSRTELYDFQGVPSYEENQELYEALGMTESQQYMLLDQYNFGLEEGMDVSVLDALSEYQASNRKQTESFGEKLGKAAGQYRYRLLHKGAVGPWIPNDYPWNYLVLSGYAAVFAAMLWNGAGKKRKFRQVWKLFFLFFVRTALWMFILIRGRDPVRITHSLYLMEFTILAAMLCLEYRKIRGKKSTGSGRKAFSRYGTALLPALLLFMAFLYLPEGTAAADSEYEDREAANVVDRGMKDYCRSHEDSFYFMDVYSTVSYPSEPYQSVPYSEKMFADVDNRMGNYDIMGGWLVKSPSYEKKLRAFSMDSMAESILYKDNVYVMAELDKGTDYFSSYFEALGIPVRISRVDTVAGVIGVYRMEAVREDRA